MHTFSEMMQHPRPVTLDPEYEGCCPCAHIQGKGFKVDIHCWRTSHDHCDCPFAGIHIKGLSSEDAHQLAEHIMDTIGWPCIDWTVMVEV